MARVILWIGRALGAGAAAALLFTLWLSFVWPPPSWWSSHWPAQSAFMAMRARQLAAARDTTPRRYRPIPLDSMSDWLEKAATAGEDDAFFAHHGIDYRALREALGYRRAAFSWNDPRDRAELARAVRRARDRPGRLRGASTLTQQLAKNLYLSPSRNPLRKLKEAAIAYRLEWALTKPRILALYLNVAEFGPNLWGVEAASRRYFGRSAARLSMDQAALLVATLPHPLTSNPAFHPGRTRWRAHLILRRLRGEDILLPVEETEDAIPPAPRAPPIDSLVKPDSISVDTVIPRPPSDTAAAPRQDTTAERRPPEISHRHSRP
ncbi:MAG: transglycosylase domain-containing protein [Gemmatimonadetes bacterium]|nr:transglycosylase domain-containing protein [Gemmatimonadota bacterium]